MKEIERVINKEILIQQAKTLLV